MQPIEENKIFIADDIKKVFENCNRLSDLDLINNYMYMYSLGTLHYFKHKETRKLVKVGIQKII
tara:strand:+ start:342 stop:533 length:192 start_codon:yes stop_codon:yes gene_type:complete